MVVAETFHTDAANQDPAVSEGFDGLAEALRSQDVEAFGKKSPTAACFVPLLNELGWVGDYRDVAEALPHFANDMDLWDLRSALVLLGYTSEPEHTHFNKVDMRLLPCLFERKIDGKLFVITGHEGTNILAFSDGRHQTLDRASHDFEGTAYFFSHAEVDEAEKSDRIANWFVRAILRFKKSFTQMLVASLIVNLLTISIPLFIMVIYDKVVGAQSLKALPFLAAGMAVILLGDIRLRTIRSEIIAAVAGRLDYLTGVAAFEKVLSFPPAMTESATVNSQMARLKEFKSLRDFFTGPLVSVLVELPFIVLVLATIYVLGGPLVLVPLAAIGAFVLLGWLWLPQVRRSTLAFGQINTQRNNFLLEASSHLRTIKDLGAEEIWQERYRQLSSRSLTLQDKVTRETAITSALSQGIVGLAGIGVLTFGALSVISGSMTTGALIATLALLWRALGPLQNGFLAFTKFREIRDSVRLVNQLMRLKSEPVNIASRLFDAAYDGNIQFQRVSFRYANSADPALVGVNFSVPKGRMLAILGSNSSGKSTILKLIAGMYQPQGGSISIDGLDVRQIDAMDLRRKIAYVPQVPEVFYGTIKQNLRLADPMASEETIAEVCDQVGLTPMLARLPDGIDTRLGDRQSDALPKGFVQRLSIARALVRGSKVLLLDEPEQNLDEDGDRMFIDLIQSLKGKIAIVLVSHRPSHIRLADQAIVLNGGALEFAGSPDEAIQAAEIIASNLARNIGAPAPEAKATPDHADQSGDLPS